MKVVNFKIHCISKKHVDFSLGKMRAILGNVWLYFKNNQICFWLIFVSYFLSTVFCCAGLSMFDKSLLSGNVEEKYFYLQSDENMLKDFEALENIKYKNNIDEMLVEINKDYGVYFLVGAPSYISKKFTNQSDSRAEILVGEELEADEGETITIDGIAYYVAGRSKFSDSYVNRIGALKHNSTILKCRFNGLLTKADIEEKENILKSVFKTELVISPSPSEFTASHIIESQFGFGWMLIFLGFFNIILVVCFYHQKHKKTTAVIRILGATKLHTAGWAIIELLVYYLLALGAGVSIWYLVMNIASIKTVYFMVPINIVYMALAMYLFSLAIFFVLHLKNKGWEEKKC